MRRYWGSGVVDRICTWRQRVSRPPAHLKLEWQPVEVHAEQLAAWLWDRRGAYARAFPDILTDYRQMCHDLGWHEHPWKTVAARLTSVTTGRKVYERRVIGGRPMRLRVYPVMDVIRRRETADTEPDAVIDPASDGVDAGAASVAKKMRTA